MTVDLELDEATILETRLLKSPALSTMSWLDHGVTSRLQNIQPGEGNIGYGPPRDKDAAWQMRQGWSHAIGVDSRRLVGIHQVHGGAVIIADARLAGTGSAPGSTPAGEADALITNEANLPLMTLHADCQSIFFADPVQWAVGVAHAGWRGVVSDIGGETVRAMASNFGSAASDIRVFLGPAIGRECYEVGLEVIEAWYQTYDGQDASAAVTEGRPRPHFDLTRANHLLLERAGVPADQIEESGVCTRCRGDQWFSHRGQGPVTGRFAAVIAINGFGA